MPKSTFFNLPQAKRDHIIQIAMDEFAKEPYQNISINHLIKAMNIPTGSFYQYFEDKKDLYFYILSFYADGVLEESIRRNLKLDLLDPAFEVGGMEKFTESKKMKYYQEIFVDNLNIAPGNIRRDWTFDQLIGSKYMAQYDCSLFEEEGIDPQVKEQKFLFLGLAMTITNVVHQFCDFEENPEEHLRLYQLCVDVMRTGIQQYRSDKKKI